MSPINNVNVNVLKSNNNNNVNEPKNSLARSKSIDSMIDKLQSGLQAKDESRPFLAKSCWKLPESSIWSNYEAAQKGKNPMGLFIWLCKKQGV